METEIARVEKALCEHIRKLLESIPGISTLTAQKILAELGDAREYACSGSAAAYAGLAPQNHTSGTSVRKRTELSKNGNAYLRKAMYFPTITALTWNPQVKDFYERLVAVGKPKMVALGAVMRKLLMIAVGVLRSGRPFDPHWSEHRAEKVVEQRQRVTATAT